MLFLDRSTPKPVYYMLASGELSKGCLLARMKRRRDYIAQISKETVTDYGSIMMVTDLLSQSVADLESVLAE